MSNSLGYVSFWGFTPAADFLGLKGFKKLKKQPGVCGDENSVQGDVNILLIGASDIRHVMKTVSKQYGHDGHDRKINFYILENNLEVYARDMLFLSVFLECQSRLGLQEKVELLLELYGNSFIRHKSADYMQRMCNVFIKCCTDEYYLSETFQVLDLSLLKFKERDMLEGIFKFWRKPDTSLFNIESHWDDRLRQHLGTRYDSRKGVFDWDYSMVLSDRGAEIIGSRTYSLWRDTGVAFGLRDGAYDKPNKTLASGRVVMQKGEEQTKRGYWGDITVSPYIAFGVESDNKSLFTKSNHAFTKTSEDVSTFNVTSMLHEFMHKTPYKDPEPTQTKPKEGGAKIEEIIEEEEEEVTEKEMAMGETAAENEGTVEHPSSDIPYERMAGELKFSVSFLPLNCFTSLQKRSKFRSQMDIMYFSNSMVHLWTPDTSDLLKEEATVVVETARFITSLKKENLEAYTERVMRMASAAKCTPLNSSSDPESTSFLLFSREK